MGMLMGPYELFNFFRQIELIFITNGVFIHKSWSLITNKDLSNDNNQPVYKKGRCSQSDQRPDQLRLFRSHNEAALYFWIYLSNKKSPRWPRSLLGIFVNLPPKVWVGWDQCFWSCFSVVGSAANCWAITRGSLIRPLSLAGPLFWITPLPPKINPSRSRTEWSTALRLEACVVLEEESLSLPFILLCLNSYHQNKYSAGNCFQNLSEGKWERFQTLEGIMFVRKIWFFDKCVRYVSTSWVSNINSP